MSNVEIMPSSSESHNEITHVETAQTLVAELEPPKEDAPKVNKQPDAPLVKPATRPSSAKPNIYALITNTAKQKEAERAAKAVDRQKVKEQQATTLKSTDSPKSKRIQQMPSLLRSQTPALRSVPTPITNPALKPMAASAEKPAEAKPLVSALAADVTQAVSPTPVIVEVTPATPAAHVAPAPVAATPTAVAEKSAQPSAPAVIPISSPSSPSVTTGQMAESKPTTTSPVKPTPQPAKEGVPATAKPTRSPSAHPSTFPTSNRSPLPKSPVPTKSATGDEPLRLTQAELDRLLAEAAEGADPVQPKRPLPAKPAPRVAPTRPATPAFAPRPASNVPTRGTPATGDARYGRTNQQPARGGTFNNRPSSGGTARYAGRGNQAGGRPPMNRGTGQQPVAARSNVPANDPKQSRDGQRDRPRDGQRSPQPVQARPARGPRDNTREQGPAPALGLTVVAPTTSTTTRGRNPNDAKPVRVLPRADDRRRGARSHNRANIRPTKVVAKPAPLHALVKPVAPPPLPSGPVALPAVIMVRELAPLLRTTTGEMIKKLMELKIFATINQSLNYDTASLIAEELGIETKPVEEEKSKPDTPAMIVRTTVAAADQDKLKTRPPVVTILGHVDHGKTSLLDAIRSANVAAGEAGGITQHIGAYQVEKQGRKITFLDTPGHAAFTAMRARGAQVTDVAVLVVAADDGVMPQTKEAINHARAANVPIVVALNKIDRETAEPQRVTRQLADVGVVVEEWGGDTPIVKVSAKKLIGIDALLEMILLVADLADLKANPDRSALGSVIEAEMDRSRGPMATLLVQQGTLHTGDYVVVNDLYGRVRAMFNERDQKVEAAGPSTPVVVLGLSAVPQAGDTFKVAKDERTARAWVEKVTDAQVQITGRAAKALSLDDLYAQMQAGKIKELNIVLKVDVQGSIEPIRNSLEKLSSEELRVRILHQATGNISESDVSLALASGAIVIGFHVEPDPAAERLARNEGVDVRTYAIIYKLIEDVEKALKGLLEPTYKEVITGHAEVRMALKVAKRNVAGSYITDGKAIRSGQVRLLRAGKPVYDGRVASLKRFTEDVREVATNFECGIMLENFEDVKQGDIIEFYHKEKEA